jgi:2-oxoglutarate ferredoxin oxidoreductase subunit gamma
MLEEILIAGFGGQGVMMMGRLLAHACMQGGFHVSWFPSYGPEIRGGTAHCSVVISTAPIGSPVVSEASSLIVLNQQSLDKFEQRIAPGGLLFMNTSLVRTDSSRRDINFIKVAANDAEELGSLKVANMVMLGAYISVTHCISLDLIEQSLPKVLDEKYYRLIPLNVEALRQGRVLKEWPQSLEGSKECVLIESV